jgi:hypothetical protein
MIEFLRVISFFTFILITGYYAWANTGLTLPNYEYESVANSDSIESISLSYDKKLGNLLGIQAYMVPADYSSSERFYRKLESYLLSAKKAGYLNSKTIILFPEDIGTPLVLLGEKRETYLSSSLKSASDTIVYSNLISYIKSKILNRFSKNRIETLLYMKANIMAEVYKNTFSKLSAVYGVHILAGSIVLPNAKVIEGNIILNSDNLKNTAFLFSPAGKIILNPFHKKRIYDTEKFLKPGEPSENILINLPDLNQNLIFLFGNETNYIDSYSSIATSQNIIISSSILTGREKIDWANPEISSDLKNKKPLYSESDKPLDTLSLWQKYSLPEKYNSILARAAMQVFLKGKFFEYELQGQSFILQRYVKNEILPKNSKSYLINFWF